jgi:drug/metabolite transporter (DMT)-like permease
MDQKKTFEPFLVLGVFWSLFGLVVLAATFFVRERPQVPAIRGIVTNIMAGLLLLAIGITCILKGRTERRKKRAGP